jgi:hypothetical protein
MAVYNPFDFFLSRARTSSVQYEPVVAEELAPYARAATPLVAAYLRRSTARRSHHRFPVALNQQVSATCAT